MREKDRNGFEDCHIQDITLWKFTIRSCNLHMQLVRAMRGDTQFIGFQDGENKGFTPVRRKMSFHPNVVENSEQKG